MSKWTTVYSYGCFVDVIYWVEQPLVGLEEFGGEIGNQREQEQEDLIGQIESIMEVVTSNAYFRRSTSSRT